MLKRVLKKPTKCNFLVALLLISSSSIAVSGDRAFFCTVKNIYKLSAGGAIESESGPAVPRIGDFFSVDRRTGVVAGERIPVIRPEKFAVLSAGNDGNGFTLSYSARTQVSFLRIESWRDIQPVPFTLLDGIWIASGTCK